MNSNYDSFKISPIYSDSAKKQQPINKETTNGKNFDLSLSGSDERDFNYLGSDDKDDETPEEKGGLKQEPEIVEARN